MKVKLNSSALGQSHWYEYLIRFVFGGAVAAVADVLAKRFGPGIGGLFLAFPAIFPAAVTLIANHEQKKESSAHNHKEKRAIVAAGLDAIGSALGGIGLIVFALVVWQLLPSSKPILVLPIATLAWAVTSVLAWELREIVRKHARHKRARDLESTLTVPVHVGSPDRRMK